MKVFSTRASLADIAQTIDVQSQRQHAEVVAWRRHMHRHPELSFREVDTARFLERELAAIKGLEVSRPRPPTQLAGEGGGRKGGTMALGAELNAQSVIEGLRQLKECSLNKDLAPQHGG